MHHHTNEEARVVKVLVIYLYFIYCILIEKNKQHHNHRVEELKSRIMSKEVDKSGRPRLHLFITLDSPLIPLQLVCIHAVHICPLHVQRESS